MSEANLRVVTAEEQVETGPRKTNKEAYPELPEEVRAKAEKDFLKAKATKERAEADAATYKKMATELGVVVREHGVHTQDDLPDDAIVLIAGHKVQWLGRRTPVYTVPEGIVYLNNRIGELEAAVGRGTRKAREAQAQLEALREAKTQCVVLRETIDTEAFEVLRAAGALPPDFVEAVYKDRVSYGLRFWETETKACPACKEAVATGDKFCKSCGHSLSKGRRKK